MKRVLQIIALLLLVGVGVAYWMTLPAGDMDEYRAYFLDDQATLRKGGVKVTFLGTSSLLFDDGKTQLLIDGYFSRPRMLPLLFSEIKSDTALIDERLREFGINRLKGIFVTHSHVDHVFDVAYTTRKTGATLYGSISTLNVGKGGGVADEKLELFQPDQAIQLGDFSVQIIRSKHSHPNSLADDGVLIQKPLPQPAKMKAYAEGGSYDFLIKHNGHAIFVKPSANFVAGALDSLRAEVVFVGIATLNKHDSAWQNEFYTQTVGRLKPNLVIPVHWDDFMQPLSESLVMLPRFTSDTRQDFDFMIQKTKADGIDFRVLQGTKSVVLFQ